MKDVDLIVEAITDEVGSAMHEAMSDELSFVHVDRTMWEKAVENVQAAAEKEIRRLLKLARK